MSTAARRERLPNPATPPGGQHAGLILARYLERPVQAGNEQSKQDLFAAARAALQNKSVQGVYKLACERWLASLPKSVVAPEYRWLRKFRAESPIIVGLGGENVTETGLTLHHTYGVPYLPGSALKGLASHYAAQVWGAADPSWLPDTPPLDQPNHYRTLFGTSGEGGLVDFLDGWLTLDSLKNCLVDDVMTPHHGDYYMADDRQVREPSDFDSPVPVPFLAVRGAFHIAVTKRDVRLPDQWLDTALELLTLALAEFGIGAKTNAGYGRLAADSPKVVIDDPEKPPTEGVVEEDPAEVIVEIIGSDESGRLEVMTLDGEVAGIIHNSDEVPAELRAEGEHLIASRLPRDGSEQIQFKYLMRAP